MLLKDKALKQQVITNLKGLYKVDEGNIEYEASFQGQNDFSSNFLINKGGKKSIVKVILKNKLFPETKQTIENESKIAKEVSSNYILKLESEHQDNDYLYIQFPYLDGKNLRQYVEEKGKLNEVEIKNIAISLLRGLSDIARVAQGSIVHQDIKPENIFIKNDGSLVILDFGSARYKEFNYVGKAKKNKKFCSPEQIKTCSHVSPEELRLNLMKSDIYAAGLVLYWLIEGKHPFDDERDPVKAIASGKAISRPTRENINDSMKDCVLKMLEYNPLNRFDAQDAIKAFETGKIELNPPQTRQLYYVATNYNAKSNFVHWQQKKVFDGVIIEANYTSDKNKHIQELKESSNFIVIDPVTYLFTKPAKQKKTFKNKISYVSKYEDLFSDSTKLLSLVQKRDERIKDFIREIFDFQIERGATVLVPPYFYVSDINDNYWTIDNDLTTLSEEIYINEYPKTYPLYKGVCISTNLLETDKTRMRFSEYLMSLSGFSGFVILLESNHVEVIQNQSWLKAAREFFNSINKKHVIWNKADLIGLIMNADISIAIGENKSQRKFDLQETESTNRRKTSPYVYIAGLFARVKWTDGYSSLKSYKDLPLLVQPHGNPTSHFDFDVSIKKKEAQVAEHNILTYKYQFDNYKKNRNQLQKDLEFAKESFDKMKGQSALLKAAIDKDVKPSSKGFLEVWTDFLGF